MLLGRVLAESALSAPNDSLGKKNSQPPCSTAVLSWPTLCLVSVMSPRATNALLHARTGRSYFFSWPQRRGQGKAIQRHPLHPSLVFTPTKYTRDATEMLSFSAISSSRGTHFPMPLLPQVYHNCQGVPVCWEGRGCCSSALVLLAHDREGKHLYKASEQYNEGLEKSYQN